MNNKPVLAYDCASFGASFALMVAGEIHGGRIEQSHQAAELIPAIDTFMAEAGIAYRDLGCLVSTTGPGSFTGVRISLAALHGLSLATQVPVKTLTTLEAMAWDVAQRADAPTRFIIALKAGKGEVYAQDFKSDGEGKPCAVSDITLLPETHAAWDAPCFGNHLPEEDVNYLAGPHAEILCAIASHLPITPLKEAVPLYIRPPDAIAKTPHPWLQKSE